MNLKKLMKVKCKVLHLDWDFLIITYLMLRVLIFLSLNNNNNNNNNSNNNKNVISMIDIFNFDVVLITFKPGSHYTIRVIRVL